MATVYGIEQPAGIRKAWEATSMEEKSAGAMLRRYHAPEDWGDPTNCVAWFDDEGDGPLRVCVAHYANGRSATLRRSAARFSLTLGRA